MCAAAGCIMLGLSVVPQYCVETYRSPDPFTWRHGDPRTYYFSAHLFFQAEAVLWIGGWCMQRWLPSLPWLDLEVLSALVGAAGVSIVPFISRWHLTRMLGKDPNVTWQSNPSGFSGDMEIVLLQSIILTGSMVYGATRVHILAIIPLFAITAFVLILIFVGSSDPASLGFALALHLLSALFATHGAWIHEKVVRERFIELKNAEEKVVRQEVELREKAAVAKGMEVIATVLCDFVVSATRDLQIISSDMPVHAFFGLNPFGLNFLDFVDTADKDRVLQASRRAEALAEPQSVPSSLRGRLGVTSTRLLVVCIGAELQHYLVGVTAENFGVPPPAAGSVRIESEDDQSRRRPPVPSVSGHTEHSLTYSRSTRSRRSGRSQRGDASSVLSIDDNHTEVSWITNQDSGHESDRSQTDSGRSSSSQEVPTKVPEDRPVMMDEFAHRIDVLNLEHQRQHL